MSLNGTIDCSEVIKVPCVSSMFGLIDRLVLYLSLEDCRALENKDFALE